MGILLASLLLAITKFKRVIFIKRNFLILTCLIFTSSLVFLSGTSFKSALYGINLWLNVVFPSLFPFFVASEFLSRTGFVRYLGILLEPLMRPLFNVPGCGSFALAMGIISGYPVGAKITAAMREDKFLTRTEAERLISFTNNSGPLFIIGAVSVGIFNKPEIGIFLWFFHVLASLTVGFAFKFYHKTPSNKNKYCFKETLSKFKKEYSSQSKDRSENFGSLLRDAVNNSIMMVLTIGGFIILFSVIINLLSELRIIHYLSLVISFIFGINNELISNLLGGFFEITTGINMISKTTDLSLLIKLASVAFLIGWAGLSVHFQVLSIISKTDISPKPYILGKFLQGIFQCIYTIVGLDIISMHSKIVIFNPIKNTSTILNYTFDTYYHCSGIIPLLISVLIIVLSFLKTPKKSKY